MKDFFKAGLYFALGLWGIPFICWCIMMWIAWSMLSDMIGF
jgi:hypothetical protein